MVWLLAQKAWIVPIPGTTRQSCLDENLGAVNIHLTAGDLGEIEKAAGKVKIDGARYPEAIEKMTGR